MPKVINIEPTPNPDALKFVVQRPILRQGVRSFRDFASAVGDPLGSALFALGQVASVFYMDRFVTVNKEKSAEWSDLIDAVCDVIEDQPESEREAGAQEGLPEGTLQDEALARINQVLDVRVRPGLAGDGGGVEVIGFDGETLEIRYHGACGSCPSAMGGTLSFIEGVLQEEVDPKIRVISY